MDFKVNVTVDLSDRVMGLFGGVIASKFDEKVDMATAKNADAPTVEEAPAPRRQSTTKTPSRLRPAVVREAPVAQPEAEPSVEAVEEPTPAAPAPATPAPDVTHDDARALMRELIDDTVVDSAVAKANQQLIAGRLRHLEAKSIGMVKDADLEGFYAFLADIKRGM